MPRHASRPAIDATAAPSRTPRPSSIRFAMTAQLIDGNALSKTLRADVARRAADLTARGHKPGLAVVLVGDNPASEVYVRNKVKACQDNGLHSVMDRFPATLSES